MVPKISHKDVTSPEVRAILEVFQRGDMAVLPQVYEIFAPKLIQYGCIICPEKQLVEDVVQDFFLWIYKHPHKLKDIKRFDLYAFSSIKQNLYAYHTKQSLSNASLAKYTQESKIINEWGEISQEVKLMDQEEGLAQRKFLKKELGKLPAHLRELLFLRYYEGLSYEEISEMLNLSQQVARNYVSRAIKRIRKNLPTYTKVFINTLGSLIVIFC